MFLLGRPTASRGFYLGRRSGTASPFIHSYSPFRCPLCQRSSDKLLTRPATAGPQRQSVPPAVSVALLSRGGVCPSVSRGGVPSRRGGAVYLCARPASRVPPWWRVRWCPLVASRGAGFPVCYKARRVSAVLCAARGAPVWRVPFSPLVSFALVARRVWRVSVPLRRVWRFVAVVLVLPLPRVPWWWTWRACPVLVSRGGASRAAGGLYKAKDKNGAPAVRWCVFGGFQ